MPQWLTSLYNAIKGLLGTKPKPPPTPPHIPHPMVFDVGIYRAKLRSTVDQTSLQPVRGTDRKSIVATHAHTFVQGVCHWFKYTEFDGMTPSNIYRAMKSKPHTWGRVTCAEAIELAKSGGLVIAAQAGPSEHVCIVAPEPYGIYSNKWNKVVPYVVSVGRDNWYGKGMNWAPFATEPELFHFLGV
jgi:hypothetical protein